MNKEFRVWDDKHIFADKKFWYSNDTAMSDFWAWVQNHGNDLDKVQQYTGLTDSTGKKIFEGDIVLFQEKYKYQIYWLDVDASFDLALVNDDDSFFYMPTFRCGSALQMKVIGNIFETPELLK